MCVCVCVCVCVCIIAISESFNIVWTDTHLLIDCVFSDDFSTK